jgi:hypothetical protein
MFFITHTLFLFLKIIYKFFTHLKDIGLIVEAGRWISIRRPLSEILFAKRNFMSERSALHMLISKGKNGKDSFM